MHQLFCVCRIAYFFVICQLQFYRHCRQHLSESIDFYSVKKPIGRITLIKFSDPTWSSWIISSAKIIAPGCPVTIFPSGDILFITFGQCPGLTHTQISATVPTRPRENMATLSLSPRNPRSFSTYLPRPSSLTLFSLI